jgi:lipopolysaccharide heptosyltransferase II
MNVNLLKRLDRLAGPLLTRLFRKRGSLPDPPAPRSALVIRPGGIGDAVLLVPALRALQSAYPGCRIDILAEKRNASVFTFCSCIRRVHCYDTRSGLGAALLGSYDLVIDTEQWYRLSALIARLTRAPRLIGFATSERGRLFTDPVSYSQDRYEAYSFFSLLEPLGIAAPAAIETPFLTVPAAALESARGFLTSLSGNPFVALFPGASVEQKQWGTVNFRELAAKLCAGGMRVVIVGGEDSRAAGEEIARGGVALNLAGRASLAETAALIGKGRALVSGDSGLLHIAAGLGTPTVSIFGPSDPRKWGPKGERDLVFGAGLPCAPCSRFGTIPCCPNQACCSSAVTVAEVVAAVRTLLLPG